MRGRLHLTAVTRRSTTFCGYTSPEVREALRPQHHRTAVTTGGRRGIDLCPLLHHHLVSISDGRVLALPAAAHVNITTALCACGCNPAALAQQNVLSLYHHLATMAGGVICTQLTGEVNYPAVTTIQNNITVLAAHAPGFHHTGHVQHRVQQHILTQCRQVHLTVCSTDQPPIFHQGIHHLSAYLNGCQTRIIQLQRDPFTGSQHRLPARGTNGAAVADFIRRQHDVATRCRGQITLTDNLRSGLTLATERVATVHEIIVFNVARGGHKTSRVHARALTKQHTVRVNQEHLTVCLQVTHDFRSTASSHPVQCHCTAVRLVKLHRVTLANIKTLPVHYQVLAVLMDIHLAARRRLDAAGTTHNLSPDRQPGSQSRIRHHYQP